MNGQTNSYLIGYIILAEVFLKVCAINFSRQTDDLFSIKQLYQMIKNINNKYQEVLLVKT